MSREKFDDHHQPLLHYSTGMKHKKNELWKLDLLESKFTQAAPRFSATKRLLHARNNTQLLKKLPQTPTEAFAMITALKHDLFEQKWHGSHKKLLREVQRKVKQDLRGWTKAHASLKAFFAQPENVRHLVSAKLAKTVQAAVLTTKELRQTAPAYLPGEVVQIVTDKTHASNPSQFFKTHCQNDKVLNGYVSSMWNDKLFAKLVQEIDWSFRKIRGALTAAEKAAHASSKTAAAKTASPGSEGESASDDSDDDAAHSDADAADQYSDLDNLVGGSEDEDSEEAHESGLDSEPAAPVAPKDKKKVVLPLLATGYFSGGSDDESDVDNDQVVKAATTVRKNRRGQRARQKIWEMKYGKNAVHVQKEQQRAASEREQRQLEFEERQRKREAKAKAAAVPAGEKKKHVPTEMHPSWQAKKLEEERANAKFQGKKITFE